MGSASSSACVTFQPEPLSSTKRASSASGAMRVIKGRPAERKVNAREGSARCSRPGRRLLRLDSLARAAAANSNCSHPVELPRLHRSTR